MSNIDFIFEEKAADIGNFLVGRLLPFRQKRNIGPFVFIDHMGPAHMTADENLDVSPHPHIGLSTLTFLFEGAVAHKDSLGNDIVIKPGAVNWMTAGKGVVHSERTPDYLRTVDKTMHGLQIWIALPKHLENMEPNFVHIEAKDLPVWQEDNLDFKLIAGEFEDKKSGVPVYSRLYMIEIKANETQTVHLKDRLYGESGLYILEGSIKHQDTEFGEKQILITKDAHLCEFEISAGSTVYLFGGEPFPEERFIYWNFVSSSRETIEEAKLKWQAHEFPKVPGETDFVPLPVDSFKKS
ncbi:pirin family protein [Paenimyroides baculatum]|uniref:Pirin family protein n=1 Tax=Paenimyroides baculatum TaxID=2608000 RepID=A0A5M6CZ99_9FLAO|nr:pirin family protein [Paenimyroides baculatum]KAA5538165.1 pirin family protein [Paenimyroides baculatum]